MAKKKKKLVKKKSVTKNTAARPPDQPPKIVPCLGVFVNHAYKTCIGLARLGEHVRILILKTDQGLVLQDLPVVQFETDWRLESKSTVSHAVKIYAEYIRYLGASDEALTVLKQFTPLTQQEVLVAKQKANERAHPVVLASSAKGKAMAKAAEKKKTQPKKETTKSVFVQLIMEGKLTDEQIFAKAQEKCGLPDTARSYVAWYRNDLQKKGANPPARKVGKTETKTKPAAKPVKNAAKKTVKKATKAKKPTVSAPTIETPFVDETNDAKVLA